MDPRLQRARWRSNGEKSVDTAALEKIFSREISLAEIAGLDDERRHELRLRALRAFKAGHLSSAVTVAEVLFDLDDIHPITTYILAVGARSCGEEERALILAALCMEVAKETGEDAIAEAVQHWLEA